MELYRIIGIISGIVSNSSGLVFSWFNLLMFYFIILWDKEKYKDK